MPAGGRKAVFRLPGGQIFLQPPAVIGQGPKEIVDLQNGLPGCPVGAALAVEVGKGAEVGVLVGLFQGVGQGRRPQGLDTARVGGGKVRGDVQGLEVPAEQIQTKGVDGADGGPLQEHPLAAEPGAAGLGQAALKQRLADPCPQLGGGGVGKGDD